MGPEVHCTTCTNRSCCTSARRREVGDEKEETRICKALAPTARRRGRRPGAVEPAGGPGGRLGSQSKCTMDGSKPTRD